MSIDPDGGNADLGGESQVCTELRREGAGERLVVVRCRVGSMHALGGIDY